MVGNRAIRCGGFVLLLALGLVGCDREDAIAQDRPVEQEVRERLGDVPAVADTTAAAVLSGAFRAAAAAALPGVVTVQVTAQPQRAQQQSPFPFPFPFGQPDGEAPPQIGTGSGFVFRTDGHIITNNHVVENATRVQVRFPNGRIYNDVEVVGRDPSTDIAVIRIEPQAGHDLTALEIGDSEQIQVGDWVLALGNPLQLGFTVTAGIVSAKGRSLNIIPEETALEAFIQTDAAINRGNSGGPLVDLRGRVVGVNTAIYSPTGAYAGNGFAVPSAIAARVASDIVEHGRVRRPRIGVLIQDVEEAQAELYGLDRIEGALVTEVQPDGPAADAGLRPEDVVITLDGQRIRSASDLTTRLALRQPGEEVTLGVVRDGRRVAVELELGEFQLAPPEQPARQAADAEQRLGIGLANVTPEVLRQLGIRGNVEGVLIASVSPFGPAAGRVQRGDIILEFNRERVTGVDQLRRLASGVERGDVVVMRIRRAATGNEGVVSFRLN